MCRFLTSVLNTLRYRFTNIRLRWHHLKHHLLQSSIIMVIFSLFEDKVIHPMPFLLIVPCLHRIHKSPERPLDEFSQPRLLRLQIPLNVPAADLVILILLLQKRPNNQKLSKDYCKNRLPSPSAWLLCRHR